MKYIFQVFIFILAVDSCFAQMKTFRIQDDRLIGKITLALEESDKLRGDYRTFRYQNAIFLIDVLSREVKSIFNFRVMNKNGVEIVEKKDSEDEMQTLLGEELVEEIRNGQYQYEIIEPSLLSVQLSINQSRELNWWSDQDIYLSANRVVIKLGREFGLLLEQGDILFGLPQHTAGYSKIGLTTGSAMIGLHVPFAEKFVSTAERKLDGAIGGLGSVYLYEGKIGIGATGYYQVINNPHQVNYQKTEITYRSPFGGVGYIDYFIPIGSVKHILQLQVGAGTHRIETGKVVADKIIRIDSGENNRSEIINETMISPIIFLRYYSNLISRTNRDDEKQYRTLEIRGGYSFKSCILSISFFLTANFGLNIQGSYSLNPQVWQQKYVLIVSPIIKFDLF